MLKALLRHRKVQPEARPEPQARIDIIFLDEPKDDRDEVNTFMRSPVVPRVGEVVTLDGYFRRGGAFVVERVEYLFCCESRSEAGWVRDLSVCVSLYVREK